MAQILHRFINRGLVNDTKFNIISFQREVLKMKFLKKAWNQTKKISRKVWEATKPAQKWIKEVAFEAIKEGVRTLVRWFVEDRLEAV